MSDKKNEKLLQRMEATRSKYHYSLAVEVFKKYPQNFKQYASVGLRLFQEDELLGSSFFSQAQGIIKNAPDSLPYYVTIALELSREKNTDVAFVFFRTAQDVANKMPHLFKQYAHAGACKLKKQKSTRLDYFKRTEDLLSKLDPTNTYTEDELLLEYIHDQKSAHAVGQVIDKTKYGKEYAEKCGRFY